VSLRESGLIDESVYDYIMDDNDAEDLLNQNNTSELTTGDFEEL
jgi:hypothetical protein